tara:strand:+ start:446 stop:1135 length:690 start_codon:yes stop_codon:yes gene_type:complete
LNHVLDTAYSIETPEGVNLTISIAGPVVRFLAWCIDFLIRTVIYILLIMVLPQFGEFGMGVFLLALFLAEWFYPVLFEVYNRGQTPGKRSMNIRVLNDTGLPVNWSTSLIRNLLRSVDFLPVLYGFGLVSMLLTSDFKRLGDLAAGTVVAYADPPKPEVELPEATPRPPSIALRLAEQRAVLDYAERAPMLSEARADELADIARPLTDCSGEVGRRRLYEIANWLQGKR